MKILISGFSSGGTIKKIYKKQKFNKLILFVPEKFLNNAKSFLKINKFKGKIYKSNVFELSLLIQVIGDVIPSVEEHELIVNITEGNNLLAAVLLCSSYYYGLKTVIVLEGKNGIIELPIPCLKESRSILSEKSKKLLIKIEEKTEGGKKTVNASELSRNPKRIGKHLKILRKLGFIEEEKGITKKLSQKDFISYFKPSEDLTDFDENSSKEQDDYTNSENVEEQEEDIESERLEEQHRTLNEEDEEQLDKPLKEIKSGIRKRIKLTGVGNLYSKFMKSKKSRI